MLKVAKINEEKDFLYLTMEVFKERNGKKCGKTTVWYYLAVEDTDEWEIGEELELDDFDVVESKEVGPNGKPFLWLN